MNTSTASKINNRIKTLPENILLEIDKYIDFLTYKSSNSDWAEELSAKQTSLIEKGKKDIEESRIYTHQEAKKKIADYIKNKTI